MRSIVILLVLVAMAPGAQAQTRGTITGRITDPDGVAVANAPIQAKDNTSGTSFRAISSVSGEYSINAVPSGTYDLTVKVPGFRFAPFLRPNLVVHTDTPVRIDIGLQIGVGLDTFADDPFTFLADIRAKAAHLTGPTPRTADGRPDLSGVWFGNDDLYPDDPALLPWAAASMKELLQNDLG
jgi:hypothetical protein